MNEAERLANRFEFEVMHRRTSEPDCVKQDAAAELRRLSNLNAELIQALKNIYAIQNKEFGGEWEEIGEARNIALQALKKTKQQ